MPKLSPPPKLPERIEDLLADNDFTELEYDRMKRLRENEIRNAESEAQLSEHDKIEKKIQASPEKVMQEAHEALDHGTSLLLKLIRHRCLRSVLHPTELGKADGMKARETDHALECLVSRIEYSNRQLIRLAEIGTPGARRALFFEAKKLSQSFIRLAQADPDDFRDVAESSLTMPSLRARNPAFSADAKKIAERIHLGEKHPAAHISDNRERLGALCHLLVAEFVNDISYERERYQYERENYERLKVFSETAEEYRNVSFHDSLKNHYYPTRLEDLLISAELPELKENPRAWWDWRVLPMVKQEFARLHRRPARNAALWEELKAKTPKDTPAAMRRLMEKNCRNKLFKIAEARP